MPPPKLTRRAPDTGLRTGEDERDMILFFDFAVTNELREMGCVVGWFGGDWGEEPDLKNENPTAVPRATGSEAALPGKENPVSRYHVAAWCRDGDLEATVFARLRESDHGDRARAMERAERIAHRWLDEHCPCGSAGHVPDY
jgi:hypothetical protein